MEWNLRSDRNIRDHLVQPFNMKAKEPYTSGVLGFACSPLVKKKRDEMLFTLKMSKNLLDSMGGLVYRYSFYF